MTCQYVAALHHELVVFELRFCFVVVGRLVVGRFVVMGQRKVAGGLQARRLLVAGNRANKCYVFFANLLDNVDDDSWVAVASLAEIEIWRNGVYQGSVKPISPRYVDNASHGDDILFAGILFALNFNRLVDAFLLLYPATGRAPRNRRSSDSTGHDDDEADSDWRKWLARFLLVKLSVATLLINRE